MNLKTKWFLAGGVVCAVVVSLYFVWRYETLYPSTSDAYLTANVVRIAPRVSGKIVSLPVMTHQHVNAGQLLLKLDKQPFVIALHKSEAALQLAKQQWETAKLNVETARADIDKQQALYDDALRQSVRTSSLYKRHAISKAELDSAVYHSREASAALKAAKSVLEQADHRQQMAQAQVDMAATELDQARLKLSYTQITAPADGILGEIEMRPGDIINAGQALFPLVEDNTYWVSANYKETDLMRIHPGQPAMVQIDMYPNKNFKGVVDSLSPASGVAFSLLPPENATGNWVKVTQRFPVRIRIDQPAEAIPLRIGSSSFVRIDTSKSKTTHMGQSHASKPNA